MSPAANITPNTPIGIGILGLGFMGRAHVAAINEAIAADESCELVAVCDRDPEHRAGRFKGASGNLALEAAGPLFDPSRVRAYADVDELLADPRVHLVIVATHTESHVEMSLRAIAAGKHVLVEKPVSLDTAQARTLHEAAQRAWTEHALVCVPAMCMRHWPGWDWLDDRISDGEHGQLRSLSIQRMGTRPAWADDFYADFARSGGAFGDLHVHDSDFICWSLAMPEAVTTHGTPMHCTTFYHYPSTFPAHCTAQAAWDLTPGSGFRMRYLAIFEKATAEFDLAREHRLMLYRDGRAEPVPIPPGAGYLPQLRGLCAALRGELGGFYSSMEDAVWVAELMDAERRSMQSGQTVRLT
jgi:predicted dehydrogenase